MKKMRIPTILLCFIALLMFPVVTAQAGSTGYTYTYDFWGYDMESPDAYRATEFVTGEELGIGRLNNPRGMYVRDNRVYVCDTGNNRIVILEKANNKLVFVDEFEEFTGDTDVKTFSAPNDIFVDDNGDIYIADTNNQRVVHLNSNLELIKTLTRPQDETVNQEGDFLPLKLVVDFSGRAIVLVRNFNQGFLQYDNNGDFTGYTGANEVKFSVVDYIWKRIATKEQRAQMEQFVPTEYNNLTLDKDAFIYCTTSMFDENELLSDKAKPIRQLNAQGDDILVKNGYHPPIGDVIWADYAGSNGPSTLIDITTLDNETYYALDSNRSRIFGYDSQGNLLYAFGSLGNRLGYFQRPVAIDHMGYDLLVLDAQSGGVTRFELTQFGLLINKALAEYERGNYDESADYWREVLMQNGNYDLAYIGIGRSLLRQERYEEAMNYFEVKYDDDNYSKAFLLYRKQWVEENIFWIVVLVVALIVVSKIGDVIRKIKRISEVDVD